MIPLISHGDGFEDAPKGGSVIARMPVYGTRDAGAIWEECYRGALEALCFTAGVSSPCCFWHEQKGLHVVVHGDDFTSLGCDDELNWLEVELAKHFEIKVRGRIGEGLPD